MTRRLLLPLVALFACISLSAFAGATISGSVVDGDLNPVAGALVTLEQQSRVIARATVNAGRAGAPFKGLGTRAIGATADVTVLELRRGDFEFVDNENTKRTGNQKLFTTAKIVAGKKA